MSQVEERSESSKFLELLKTQIEMNIAANNPAQLKVAKTESTFDISEFVKKTEFERELTTRGLTVRKVFHNSSTAALYEQALKNEQGSFITSSGALAVSSGLKTGRSPGDKRIVMNKDVEDIWWGKVNIPLEERSFIVCRERAIDYLNTRKQLFVIDAFAGWDPKYRIQVRVITCRAYHALFMKNMLVMPSKAEIKDFKPEFVIFNAGCFPSNTHSRGNCLFSIVTREYDR
jgi:phosphoenolpyruvate carboxykinase (ATP)